MKHTKLVKESDATVTQLFKNIFSFCMGMGLLIFMVIKSPPFFEHLDVVLYGVKDTARITEKKIYRAKSYKGRTKDHYFLYYTFTGDDLSFVTGKDHVHKTFYDKTQVHDYITIIRKNNYSLIADHYLDNFFNELFMVILLLSSSLFILYASLLKILFYFESRKKEQIHK